MTTMDLNVSPLGQVEGDLDVRVTLTDGVVTDAWTEAAMFRGFEIILRGKDPQAGLIMTPRICGICGGSHLYKACYAIDTAWGTTVPPNATRVRNIAQCTETLQSIPRWFYAIMGPDLVAPQYANAPLYEEANRRFAPYVGTSLPDRRHAVGAAGGDLRDLRRAVAALVVHDPGRRDVRADPVRRHAVPGDPRPLEERVAGEAVARLLGGPLAGEQDLVRRARVGRGERVAGELRLRAVHQVRAADRPGQVRRRVRQLPRHRHLPRPRAVHQPHGRGPQRGAAGALRHLRGRDVLRLRPGPRHRGHHPLVLPGHRLAAPVGRRHRPDRPRGGPQAGQVHLGQVAAVRRPRPRLRAPRGRSAGPDDDGRPTGRGRPPGQRPAHQERAGRDRSQHAGARSSPASTRPRSTTSW